MLSSSLVLLVVRARPSEVHVLRGFERMTNSSWSEEPPLRASCVQAVVGSTCVAQFVVRSWGFSPRRDSGCDVERFLGNELLFDGTLRPEQIQQSYSRQSAGQCRVPSSFLLSLPCLVLPSCSLVCPVSVTHLSLLPSFLRLSLFIDMTRRVTIFCLRLR